MQHDFHKEQPVRDESVQKPPSFFSCCMSRILMIMGSVAGARARTTCTAVLTTGPTTCESILARVKEAMRPGYSKLLINENVVPATGAWWEWSALDMTMLGRGEPG